MSVFLKTLGLVLLLILVTGTGARAQTLRQAVEGAWTLNPEIASLAAKREATAARHIAARSWFAGSPWISLGHVTDQIIQNKRARLTEGELSVPLWLPGEGTATEQVVDADLLRLDAQIAAAKLKIAGEVREAVYVLALADAEAKLAEQRVQTARGLDADVVRRTRAGDVAALESDLVKGELLEAQAKTSTRKAEFAAAQASLRALTGMSLPAASLDEPPPAAPSPDEHPRVQAANRSMEAARAALRLAMIANRDSPEIGIVASRNRDIRGPEYDSMVGLRIKIPFATEARNAPRQAAANAELLSAQAEFAAARREVDAELAAAKQGLAAAQEQGPLIAARVKALRQAQARLRRSYDAGEIALSELLRARVQLYDAEAASVINRLALTRARSRIHQAAGLVP